MGVDPGLAATGWGVVDTTSGQARFVDGGVVRTPSAAPHIVRLSIIHQGIREVVQQCAPDMAGVERVFANVNARSSMYLGEARGVAVAALLSCDIGVAELSALQIKKAITGKGRADKKQVAEMLPFWLADSPSGVPADLTDALACALAASPLLQYSRPHFRLPPIRKTKRRSPRR